MKQKEEEKNKQTILKKTNIGSQKKERAKSVRFFEEDLEQPKVNLFGTGSF